VSATAGDMFSETNFYKDYAIYLTSGVGSGQLKKITASGIVGTSRYIEIEAAFAQTPSNTTTYEIAPYIDIIDPAGTGAIAKAVVVDGKITDVLMINTGSGYSSSTVNVLGQTGYYDPTTKVFVKTTITALVRAIVSPPKGHGRDLVNELYADKVCVSVDFIKDQHPISSYSEYGLMSNPAFKTFSLEVSVEPTLLSVGEMLIQSPTASYGIIKSIVGKTIVLSNVFGGFERNVAAVGLTSREQVVVSGINTATDKFTISEIVDNSAEILLIRDDALTARSTTQTERIKLLIDF